MKISVFNKYPIVSIFTIAFALGISAIGFNLGNYEKLFRLSRLDQIEEGVTELQNSVQFTDVRKAAIQRIVDLIDHYNKSMAETTKFKIAEEIYEMDVKYDNLNIDLICATITHESAKTWDPKVVSEKGALGLMQIIPSTGKFLAEFEGIPWQDAETVLFDPINNVRLGCRYLSTLIEFYGVEGGLAAYNGGEKRAAMWLANNKADGILWQETQNYVPAVMRLYNRYRN